MRQFLILLSFLSVLLSCDRQSDENKYELIPYPNYLEEKTGQFILNKHTKMVFPTNIGVDVQAIIDQLADRIGVTSGVVIDMVKTDKNHLDENVFIFEINKELQPESYNLSINKERVLLEFSGAAGLFWGVQTIKQLFPIEIYGDNVKKDIRLKLPCVEIKDTPRFKYRGLMVDVGRHFYAVEEVKKFLDIMAVHKLNTFHWHLTDDQGWRIEIKKYPKLTEIGSVRSKTMIRREWTNFDNKPHGGFYTQDEIREIVAYAAERFITVIPEIDLPGHMVAALASYPQLGCTGGPYEVSGQWGVKDDVLCVGKDFTFGFLEDVFTEVMELFPSEYIHIGGDECPKINWEKCSACQQRIKGLNLKGDDKYTAEHYLQSYTIARMEAFLSKHGRKIIGWNEILEGGLAPNATVMSWQGADGGIEAARQGHDAIMAPMEYAYFDFYQSLETQDEPYGFGKYLPIEKVYSFDPVPEVLNEEERKHIIGAQANLWTEYIAEDDHLEYMLLPRLAAMSEVQWTQPEHKSWDRFFSRLAHSTKIYEAMGFSYAKHIFEVNASFTVNPEKSSVVSTLFTQGDAPIYYTLDGTEPTSSSPLYTEPVNITESCILKAKVKREGMETRIFSKSFEFNKATGKAITLNTLPKDKYTFNGATVLNDGLRGPFNFANGYWLGYTDDPMDITIDFNKPISVSSVKIGTLINTLEWVFPPEKITVYDVSNSNDGIIVGELFIPEAHTKMSDGLKEYKCEFPEKSIHKLRVVMDNVTSIPSWHGAKGNKAFIFVDEVIVE